MIIPLPWSSMPIGSAVLAPDGQPDLLLEVLPPLFVHLQRSGMWGLLGHPHGLLLVVEPEDPMTAAVRLLQEAFPTTDTLPEAYRSERLPE